MRKTPMRRPRYSIRDFVQLAVPVGTIVNSVKTLGPGMMWPGRKTSFCSLASVPDWSEAKHCFGEWNASCVTSSAGDLSWALMKPCRPYMCLNVDAVISALCGISEENQQCQDANWKWDRRSRLEAERTAKTLEMSSRSRVVR